MSGWTIPLGTLIEKAKGNLDFVARKTVLTVYRRVTMRTPVDTGRARGGWMCTLGAPAALTEGLAAVNDTDRSGRNAIAGIQETTGQWKPLSGDTCFLTNNVPYIGVLEHGRVGNRGSNQAPRGMVALTVAELGGIAEDAAAHAQAGTFGGSRAEVDVGGAWDVGGASE
jgi:hypothetical protein